MTARRPEHRPPDTDDTAQADTALADSGERVGDVLDQVREHALRLLDEVPKPPTALRVQAGEVTVDVQWDSGPAAAPVVVTGPAAPAPVAPAAVAPAAAPAPAAAQAPAEPGPEAEPEGDAAYVTAPTVGVFYRAPEPGAEPFADAGATVTAGQQVGIVEAMKLMIPVEAEQAGRITRVLKENGDSVEYGERLFGLDPDGAARDAGEAGGDVS